jgi:hypothetical protein
LGYSREIEGKGGYTEIYWMDVSSSMEEEIMYIHKDITGFGEASRDNKLKLSSA